MINKKKGLRFGETEIFGTFLAQIWHTQPQITGESRNRGE
jgi:hypothetical protein